MPGLRKFVENCIKKYNSTEHSSDALEQDIEGIKQDIGDIKTNEEGKPISLQSQLNMTPRVFTGLARVTADMKFVGEEALQTGDILICTAIDDAHPHGQVWIVMSSGDNVQLNYI